MNANFTRAALFSAIVAIAGCDNDDNNDSSTPTQTGVFLDAAVAGIGYRTDSFEGVTDADGQYDYKDGETVTFFIGGIELPPVPAQGVITPVSIAQAIDAEATVVNPVVQNISRFLQTLDSDGDPSNGISISEDTTQLIADESVSLDFEAAATTFENAFETSVAVIDGLDDTVESIELVSTVDALNHLIASLEDENIEAPMPEQFTLQLLHFADIDGGRDITSNVQNFSALVDGLRSEYANTLLLSSGDNWIPGPEYSMGSDDGFSDLLGLPEAGRAHVAFLNALGVQASAFGNHEFDLGSEAIAELIAPATEGEGDAAVNWVGAEFPYLSANLDFSTDASLSGLVGTDGAVAADLAGQIAGYTVVEVSGHKVGVVGATTPTLATISSPGDVTVNPSDATDIDALAASIQASVDALKTAGVNKIILLAHMQQIAIEKALAEKLDGVDIIVAGGSNTLLADSNDRLRDGDTAAGAYPLQYTSAASEPVLLVNTDGDYTYLGRLVVSFDDNGLLDLSSLDTTVNGAYAADAVALNNDSSLSVNDDVAALSAAMTSALSERVGNVFGLTDVYLNGERGSVRTEETNLGRLTAEANLAYAQETDASVTLSIKNGGGIRAAIGQCVIPAGSTDAADEVCSAPAGTAGINNEGEISQLDIQTSLRFNNSLSVLTVTGTQLAEIFEHAVSGVEEGSTPGSFPQVAGMQFSFDATQAVGERIVNLVIEDSNGAEDGGYPVAIVVNGEVTADAADMTFRIVTLGYLAGGGDGYPFPSDDAANVIDLEEEGTQAGDATFADNGTEQDALAEYLLANYPADSDASTPAYSEADEDAASDSNIQNLAYVVNDTVLDVLPRATKLFEDDFEAKNLDKWTAISLSGGNDWVVESFSGNNFAVGNCYQSDGDCDDWLISPELDLTQFINASISFTNAWNYGVNALDQLSLKVSTDFDGSNVETATWTDLSDQVTWSEGSFNFVGSGDVSLDDVVGNYAHVAFHYAHPAADSTKWEIDDVLIGGDAFGEFPLSAEVQAPSETLFVNRDFSMTALAFNGAGAPYSYSWDMGDGNMATGESVTYAYGDTGVYEVLLTVTDADNNAVTVSAFVSVDPTTTFEVAAKAGDFRVASFNAGFDRFSTAGEWAAEFADGDEPQAKKVAEIIQLTDADVLLLNEIDGNDDAATIAAFQENYLEVSQNGVPAITYDYVYTSECNTGVPSGEDYNNNDSTTDPDDGYGFGNYPGQYCMAVFSKYELDTANVRTFQKFLWKDMDDFDAPALDGEAWYTDAELETFRLSSKTHIDLPIVIDGETVHVLASHPTPPVFDGEEDRNGLRNYDEIRLWADYVDPDAGDYLYDDNNVASVSLAEDDRFIIMGDLNASNESDASDSLVKDGVSAMDQLLGSYYVNPNVSEESLDFQVPVSAGGAENDEGNPYASTHTAAWRLRADYVLPSSFGLEIAQGGVFWPRHTDELFYLVEATDDGAPSSSDHRLVWMDLNITDERVSDDIDVIDEPEVIFADDFSAGNADNWGIVDQGDAGENWEWSNAGGRDHVKVSCFNASEACDDWLVQTVDLSDVTGDVILGFETAYNYGTDSLTQISLLLSSDYTGDVDAATWDDISDVVDWSTGGWTWVESGLDVTDYAGDELTFAFRYQSATGSDAATWEVTNVFVLAFEASVEDEVIYFDDFSDNNLDDWTTVSHGETDLNWHVEEFEDTYFAVMNCYNGAEACDDWMLQTFDLTDANSPVLSFVSAWNFGANAEDQISLLLSTDYTGDVDTATWDDYSDLVQWSEGGFVEAESGFIGLDSYVGQPLTIAFHYSAANVDSAKWEITDFLLLDLSGNTVLEDRVFFEDDFSDDDISDWTLVDNGEADKNWQVEDYQGTYYAAANCYQGAEACDDWMIQGIDLTEATLPELSFRNAWRFGNNAFDQIDVLVSDDYTGDVDTATWEVLTDYVTWSEGNFVFVESGPIDLSDYAGSDVYLAFHYTTAVADAAKWEITDIVVAEYATNPIDDLTGGTVIEDVAPSFVLNTVNQREIGDLSFTGIAVPATDAEQSMVVGTSAMNLNGAATDVAYNSLLKSGQDVDGTTYGMIHDKSGNDLFVSNYPEFSSILPVDDRIFVVSQFESIPGGMYLSEVSQDDQGVLTPMSTEAIDFASIEGGYNHCAATVTPWNTHLAAEEFEPDYGARDPATGEIDFWYNQIAAYHNEADLTEVNPYWYGYPVEVAVEVEDGVASATPVKHYAVGRMSIEVPYVMPDSRTLYLTDDGTNGGLFMFVADTEGDLSAGNLYAMKWNQTDSGSEDNAFMGEAALEWIDLGHANSADIKASIDAGVGFSDIFTRVEGDGGYCPLGFTSISFKGDHECLSVNPGMEQVASRLETRRYAAYMGATVEMRKEEGLTYNPHNHKMYIAISDVNRGMLAGASEDEGGPDHVQVESNDCGGIYEAELGYNDEIGSEFVMAYVYGVLAGVPADGACDVDAIAGPDNVSYIGFDTLIITEDTSDHDNNFTWSYNLETGDLTRILSAPTGAENTGPYMFNDINGFSYLTNVSQHPFGIAADPADGEEAELGYFIFPVNGAE